MRRRDACEPVDVNCVKCGRLFAVLKFNTWMSDWREVCFGCLLRERGVIR